MTSQRFGCSEAIARGRRRRAEAAISGLLVLWLIVTACSSGTKKSGAATTSQPAASGGDLVVGGVVDAASFPDTDSGFQARITRFNNSGGINGRRIKFVGALDDGGVDAMDQARVQSLIYDDHIMAMAPVVSTGFGPASSDFAERSHTPFFSWSFQPNECNSPWSYGFNGCLVGTKVLNSSVTDPISGVLGDRKNIRLAIQQNDNPSGLASLMLFSRLINMQGGQTVYSQANLPTTGAVDYTPYVQAILNAKPTLVIVGPILAQTIGMSAALKAAGYKGAIQDFQTYVPGLLTKQASVAAAIQGEYIDTEVPPQESGSPAIKQLETDLASIGQSTRVSFGDQLGYWIADLLIEMIQATAKAGRPLTGDGLYQTANGGSFSYTPPLDGGVGSVRFPEGESIPAPCAALVQVAGTQYQVRVPFKCYENVPTP